MSARLRTFAPQADALLQVAARAQHVERWTLPRSEFPAGKRGYHAWRRRLYTFHGERAAAIAAEAGYDAGFTSRLQAVIAKVDLGDAQTQALEDVACLVFLEHYFEAFAAKRGDDALVSIVRKTWAKMSARGQSAALEVPLGPRGASVVAKALA